MSVMSKYEMLRQIALDKATRWPPVVGFRLLEQDAILVGDPTYIAECAERAKAKNIPGIWIGVYKG